MSEILRSQERCYYLTPEYSASWRAKFWIYQGQGSLKVTPTAICFESGPFTLDVPFANVKCVGVGFFSRLAKPIPMAYIDVRYIQNDNEKSIFLVPFDSYFASVWQSNTLMKSWLETFTQVKGLKSRVHKPLPALNTSPTLWDILVLSGAIFLILGWCWLWFTFFLAPFR